MGRGAAALGLSLALLACAGGTRRADAHYLRYVGHDVGFEHVLLRWRTDAMPLRVYLPPPPGGSTPDPRAVLDVVREGFTDWTDAAGPGVPRFEFVDDVGRADVPVVWAVESSGDWYGAFCAYQINERQRRLDVSHILVATRYQGQPLPLESLYLLMLHEVGHALGLLHSPAPGDVMHAGLEGAKGISLRDRETLRLLYSKPNGTPVVGARSAD